MAKPGIYFPDVELFRSKAYQALTGRSAQALAAFYSKRQMEKMPRKPGKSAKWIIINNGKIVFTYAEALDDYGISQGQFTRAITQLVEVGFLDIANAGGGMFKTATLYRISERWREYKKPEFISAQRTKGMRRYNPGKKGRVGGKFKPRAPGRCVDGRSTAHVSALSGSKLAPCHKHNHATDTL